MNEVPGIRIKIGVACIDGGWHACIEWDGQLRIYDPPWASEEEAQVMASVIVHRVREFAAEDGIPVFDMKKVDLN